MFAPESGQEKLYMQAIAPIVEEVLEGFNCTIFACARSPPAPALSRGRAGARLLGGWHATG